MSGWGSIGVPLINAGEWIPRDGPAMPGNPEQVGELAEHLSNKAEEVRERARLLRDLTQPNPEVWDSDAADLMAELAQEVSSRLDLVADRFAAVAGALQTYAGGFSAAQSDAEAVAGRARDAFFALESAQRDADEAEEWEAAHPDEEWEGQDPQAGLEEASEELSATWAEFVSVYEACHDAANAARSEIEDAVDTNSPTGDLNESRIDRRRQEGIEAAQQLESMLEELGIDPDDFDPEQLANLDPDDPAYEELYGYLRDLVAEEGPAYWSALLNELGADGIRATVGVIEMFAMDQHRYSHLLPDLDVEGDLLAPWLEGFAAGTHDMAPGVQADLLDVDAWWQQHQLGLLLGGPGHVYEPGFLAQAADNVLMDEADLWDDEVDGYPVLDYGIDQPPPWDSPELHFPHALALQALADNPEAAWQFIDMDRAEATERLEILLHPDLDEMIHAGQMWSGPYTPEQLDQVRAEILDQSANTVEAAFVDAVEANPDIYANEDDRHANRGALDRYEDLVRIVGEGDIPNELRRAAGSSLVVYLDDIGTDAFDETSDADVSRPEMVAFFNELAYDDVAMENVGESLSLWAAQRSQTLVSDPNADLGDVESAMVPVAMITGAAMNGIELNRNHVQTANDGLARGIARGSAVIAGLGLAAIPEPTTTAGGIALAGVGVGIDIGTDEIAESVADAANGTEINPSILSGLVTEPLHDQLALAIAADRGREVPVDPTNTEIDRLYQEETAYDGNPVRQLDRDILWQEQNYDDPENQDWKRT